MTHTRIGSGEHGVVNTMNATRNWLRIASSPSSSRQWRAEGSEVNEGTRNNRCDQMQVAQDVAAGEECGIRTGEYSTCVWWCALFSVWGHKRPWLHWNGTELRWDHMCNLCKTIDKSSQNRVSKSKVIWTCGWRRGRTDYEKIECCRNATLTNSGESISIANFFPTFRNTLVGKWGRDRCVSVYVVALFVAMKRSWRYYTVGYLMVGGCVTLSKALMLWVDSFPRKNKWWLRQIVEAADILCSWLILFSSMKNWRFFELSFDGRRDAWRVMDTSNAKRENYQFG